MFQGFSRCFLGRDAFVLRTAVRLTDGSLVPSNGIKSMRIEGPEVFLVFNDILAKKAMRVRSVVILSDDGRIIHETPLTNGIVTLMPGESLIFNQ